MTQPVLTVYPTDTMDKIKRLFEEHPIHHIPVISESGNVLGIISQTDYLKLLHGFTLFKSPKSEEYNQAILRTLLVEEVMTRQVATLHPEDTLNVAAGFFKENRFHAIPVVDDNNQLVGIVTTHDLILHAYRDAPSFSNS